MRHHPLRRRTVVGTPLAAVGLLAATVLATSGSAAAVGTAGQATPTATSGGGCTPTATQLPDLGYSNPDNHIAGFAGGINGDTIAGWVTDSAGQPQPAIWRHGQLGLLHPPGSTSGRVFDINAKGDILGMSGDRELAWLRKADGSYQVLPNPSPGNFFSTRRLNVFDHIAGAVGPDAARWSALDAAPKILPKRPTDVDAAGLGINDWDQVVGYLDTEDNAYPARWDPDRTLHVLPGVFGPNTAGLLFANNDVGQAAGENWAIDSGGNLLGDVAVRYSAGGVATNLGTLPGENGATAYGISRFLGYVAGSSYDNYAATDPILSGHAFVWPGHGPLLTLPVPGLSYEQSASQVHGITDGGTALGWAGPVGGVLHPYVWTCAFAQGFVPPAGTASTQAASASANKAKAALRRAGAALEGGGGPQTTHR